MALLQTQPEGPGRFLRLAALCPKHSLRSRGRLSIAHVEQLHIALSVLLDTKSAFGRVHSITIKRPDMKLFFVAVLLFFSLIASAQSDLKFKQPEVNMYSGGQPNQSDLEQLKQEGVDTVINMRPLSEMSWDEKAFVESLGMAYKTLPIADSADINWENAEKLSALLEGRSEEQTLVHCASGNRVGALIALTEFQKTKDVTRALEVGRAWGMTRLEAHVSALLEAEAKK
jgi:protein tyrosine phosphatase (PTP) superfamily phosphohydrolase (DUF442 family)